MTNTVKTQKAENIYYLTLYRKSLLTSVDWLGQPHITGGKGSLSKKSLRVHERLHSPTPTSCSHDMRGHVCLSSCSWFCDSCLLTLFSEAEKGNHITQGNPAVATQLHFPLSQPPQQVSSLNWSISSNPEVPNPFYHIFKNITLIYFSLPINHVALQLSTHWINGLCCFGGKKRHKLEPSNPFLLLFVFYIRFLKSERNYCLTSQFCWQREKYFYSKIIFVHIKNKAQRTKHRILA